MDRLLPAAVCDETVQSYGTPRIAADMPLADDTLKCQLKPLSRAGYPVAFTDDQWSRLQEAFPGGVCAYGQPGVGRHGAIPWMTYSGGPDLGDSPGSAGRHFPRRALHPVTPVMPSSFAPIVSPSAPISKL